jgi:hypothetical protein
MRLGSQGSGTPSWPPTKAIVSNGLPLTKLHHAAFDAQQIGIDSDFWILVSDRLLEIHDGPFLELGLKEIVGQLIRFPRRTVIVNKSIRQCQ